MDEKYVRERFEDKGWGCKGYAEIPSQHGTIIVGKAIMQDKKKVAYIAGFREEDGSFRKVPTRDRFEVREILGVNSFTKGLELIFANDEVEPQGKERPVNVVYDSNKSKIPRTK